VSVQILFISAASLKIQLLAKGGLFAIGALKSDGCAVLRLSESHIRFSKDIPMVNLIQAGVSVFGLFTIDPALLAFLMVFVVFATLNFIEKKRID
jgi:hypothetical protein